MLYVKEIFFTLSSMYNENNGQRTYINIGLAEKFLSVYFF